MKSLLFLSAFTIQFLHIVPSYADIPILNPKETFFNGYEAYKTNDWDKAVYLFELVPEDYILSDYALYYRADALSNLGRFYEALISLERIVNDYEDSALKPQALLKIGDILSDTGNSPMAVKYFNSFIDSFPEHKEIPHALYKLAANLEYTGRKDDAEGIIKRLLIEYPLNRYAKILEMPELTVDEVYKRIQNLFGLKEYKTVIKETSGLKEDRFVMLAAKSLYYAKDYNEALKYFKNILSTADDSLKQEAMFWLGKTYSGMKDREKAIMIYNDFLHLYPEDKHADEALYKLSILSKESGESTYSIKLLEKLIKEYPSSRFKDEGRWQIAWTNYKNKDYKKAAEIFKMLENSSKPVLKVFNSGRFMQALYWQGMSLLKTGDKDGAVKVFKRLIAKPSYYEMFAKKRLDDIGIKSGDAKIDMPYEEGSIPYAQNMHIKKAYELLSIGMKDAIHIELDSPLDASSPHDLINAGSLYKDAGDFYRSRNIGRRLLNNAPFSGSHFPTALLLAYPLGYKEIVDEASLNMQIDPYLVYAVILQESAFDETAVSRAGALGLMQIMPNTGKQVAAKMYENNFPSAMLNNSNGLNNLNKGSTRSSRSNSFRNEDLFLPRINITIGTNYLKELFEEFSGNLALALAAYNAGPHMARAWLKKTGDVELDEFVEDIPYLETREYVKGVLNAYETYKRIYNKRDSLNLTDNF